jgi:hypothetical protein
LVTVSGWVISNSSAGPPSFIKFIFNGVTYVDIAPVLSQPWTRYSFNVIATGTDTLQLAFRNDPIDNGLDNFSVVTAETPLPAALPLFATGLGALGLLGWRRKRKSAAAIAAA